MLLAEAEKAKEKHRKEIETYTKQVMGLTDDNQIDWALEVISYASDQSVSAEVKTIDAVLKKGNEDKRKTLEALYKELIEVSLQKVADLKEVMQQQMNAKIDNLSQQVNQLSVQMGNLPPPPLPPADYLKFAPPPPLMSSAAPTARAAPGAVRAAPVRAGPVAPIAPAAAAAGGRGHCHERRAQWEQWRKDHPDLAQEWDTLKQKTAEAGGLPQHHGHHHGGPHHGGPHHHGHGHEGGARWGKK